MQRLKNWFKKYFIPHEGNSHEPHFLRHESVLFLLFLIIAVELGFLVQVFVVFDKTKFLAAVLPGVLTSLTNEQRLANNALPLIENTLLDEAAQLKANDMATLGYFAHTSPEGKTPWYWFGQVGYSYKHAGENLAVNFFESEDVARAWMNSPTHRANIVKPDFTEIGIGVATGIYEGRNTVFVAQLFGTPLQVAPIEIIPPQPQPQTQPTPILTPEPVTPTPTTAVAVNTVPTPTDIQILGEETITSVTPATIAKNNSVKSFIEKAMTSPRKGVAYAYGVVAALVILALLLVLFIKSELRHPVVVARGLGLVSVIILLLFVNIKVLNLETKLPSNLSANVIEALQ